MRPFRFNTKPTAHAVTREMQAEKVLSEAGELLASVAQGESEERQLEEAWDVYSAVEKFFWEFYGTQDIAKARDFVEMKNAVRPIEPGSSVNYYGDAL